MFQEISLLCSFSFPLPLYEVFRNNYWLKSSAPIFDDSQFGTESLSYWIYFCHNASHKQVGQKSMLDPKCTFVLQCTWACQVRLGWRGRASHPGGSWCWILGDCNLWRSPALLCLQGSEGPCSRIWDSADLIPFPKVQKGLYMIIPVLGISSLYLLWCWNNRFLQGGMNIEFARGKKKKREKNWVLFTCPIHVSGFAYSKCDWPLGGQRKITYFISKKRSLALITWAVLVPGFGVFTC